MMSVPLADICHYSRNALLYITADVCETCIFTVYAVIILYYFNTWDFFQFPVYICL